MFFCFRFYWTFFQSFGFFQTFREKFEAICEKVFEFGMKEHERREKELEEFLTCTEDTKEENKSTSAKLIDQFEEYRKRVGNISVCSMLFKFVILRFALL